MPKYDPQKHHRRSIRLPDYDYSQPGAYFITICTWQRQPLFGKIVNGVMQLNAAGRIVEAEWQRMAGRFANIRLDSFVVMPNHVHGIIVIDDPPIRATRPSQEDSSVWATHPSQNDNTSGQVQATHPSQNDNTSGQEPLANEAPAANDGSPRHGSPRPRPKGPPSGSLGAMIGQFKSRATKRIWKLPEYDRVPIWHRNYYEHIIRNQAAWEGIRAYIQANPQRWNADRHHPTSSPGPSTRKK